MTRRESILSVLSAIVAACWPAKTEVLRLKRPASQEVTSITWCDMTGKPVTMKRHPTDPHVWIVTATYSINDVRPPA